MQVEVGNSINWYAVHVKPRAEFRVYERLTGAGINSFLPSIERLSKWKDRTKLIQVPLFPGYLFVNTECSHVARLSILKTNGVVSLLGTIPGEPEPIPDDQVLSLKQVIDAGTPLNTHPYLREGQRVRIMRGPLCGVEGILIRKSDWHHLVLSVDILCQSTAVKIEATDVEAV